MSPRGSRQQQQQPPRPASPAACCTAGARRRRRRSELRRRRAAHARLTQIDDSRSSPSSQCPYQPRLFLSHSKKSLPPQATMVRNSSNPAHKAGVERSGLVWGINRGHQTERRILKAKPSSRKGKTSQRVATIRSVVREVAGFAPYERRAMELIRNSKVRQAFLPLFRGERERGRTMGRARHASKGPRGRSGTESAGLRWAEKREREASVQVHPSSAGRPRTQGRGLWRKAKAIGMLLLLLLLLLQRWTLLPAYQSSSSRPGDHRAAMRSWMMQGRTPAGASCRRYRCCPGGKEGRKA